MQRLYLSAIFLFLMSITDAFCNENNNISDLSFENLGQIVTSVSKKPESSFSAPAAIYVLEQEDIKQSGLTSIAELLRMVPGLHVTRSDSQVWGITSRGFNDGFGNKLLVLIDGRSVYTPLYSGVYWDVQDTFIDDIARIEVIRGPGATLWGANAVNGVINIVTKKAKETQTTTVNTSIGSEDKSIMEGRYGGKINDSTYYRIYGKRTNRDSSVTTTGDDGLNSWYVNRSGFRMDSEVDSNNSYTIQGDIYNGTERLNLALPTGEAERDFLSLAGGNIMGKWERKHDNETTSNIQVYLDRTEFHYSLLKQDINTFDIDYQYTKTLNSSHAIVAGTGYRLIFDNLRDTSIIEYDSDQEQRHLFTAFIQDTWTVIPETVNIIFGSKIEHNDFTAVEIQPNIRIAWTPTNKQTIWASIARAVRTPSRSEDDLSLAVAEGYVRWLGNENLESEVLIAHEVGYRFKPHNNWLVDTTVFYNDYDKLRTNEITDDIPLDSIIALQFDNMAKGESYGFEVASEWEITNYWKLKAGYTFLTINLHTDPESVAFAPEADEGTSAKNQFNLRSITYLSNNIQLSGSIYYVDNISQYGIEPYIRLDTRIAWEPRTGIELSVVGVNLLDDSHQEFTGPLHGNANEIERGYYAKASFKF